jgi:Aldehyde dehydrogenase family
MSVAGPIRTRARPELRRARMLIDSGWVDSLSGAPLTVENPANREAIESGWVQVNQGLGQQPGHSYGGYKESGIGREFSLEGMLDSFTQRKNITVSLNTPRRA